MPVLLLRVCVRKKKMLKGLSTLLKKIWNHAEVLKVVLQ